MQTREAKKDHVLSQTMAAAVQGVDRKLTFIPVMFILLRMWGTLQFFYGLIISKHIQCGCVHKDLRAGFVFFGYMHVRSLYCVYTPAIVAVALQIVASVIPINSSILSCSH